MVGTKSQRLIAEAKLVTIILPDGADVTEEGLVASESIDLRDRAKVVDEDGSPFALKALGIGTTTVGVQAVSGTINAKGAVFLRNYASVVGDVNSDSTVELQHGANVLGATNAHQSSPDPIEVSWLPEITSDSTRPYRLWPDQSGSLAPGGYGALEIYSRATVTLTSGQYAFTRVQLEPQAKIVLNNDSEEGPVVIYTDSVTALRGTIEALDGETASSLLLVYTGHQELRLEGASSLAIVAPSAKVTLATGGTRHQGSVYARAVGVEPDVQWTYVPFEYWNWILPPKPFVSCIYPSGRGTFAAAFGYEARPHSEITIEAGEFNYFNPDPGSAYPPVTQFQEGRVEKARWIPMGAGGLSWTIHGQTATATTADPLCDFGAPLVSTDGPKVFTEGRTYPRASVPSVPAPHPQGEVATTNGFGAGRYAGNSPIFTIPGSTVQALGGPGETPPIAGKPVSVPDGFTKNAALPVTLSIETRVHDDSGFEGKNLQGVSRMNGEVKDWRDIGTGDDVGNWSQTITVPADATFDVFFQQIEKNTFKSHESFLGEVSVNLSTGRIFGTWESGEVEKTWVFPLPITLTDYDMHSSHHVNVGLNEEVVSSFYGDNTARWSINAPPALNGNTNVCPHWTAYYVDEAVPSSDSVTEGHTGIQMGSHRVRAYPASFAKYEVVVRGARASFKEEGTLDRWGCLEIPKAALTYQDDIDDGTEGGINFFIKLTGDLDYPSEFGGTAHFDVKEDGSFIEQHMHFTAFDGAQGWALENGFRVPGNRMDLAAPWRTNASTVAATISHALSRFANHSAISIPPKTITVNVGGGVNAGTVDFAGRTVLDSAANGASLEIGGAFFPCGTNPSSSTDCRTACARDDDCAGGQFCAEDGDANAACTGDDCFCSWADQGTMKFVTAHEFGHVMQDALTGGITLAGSYTFECEDDGNANCTVNLGRLDDSPFSRFPFQLVDPPLMHEVCGCQHVNAANALHCLQSTERISRADSEGFAQFFASMIWNESSGNCRFNYYKEFLDIEGGCRVTGDPEACTKFPLRTPTTTGLMEADVTFPPVAVDCAVGQKWRNRNECGLSNIMGLEELEMNLMGTELDWMTFLNGIFRDRGLNDLIRIYNAACHPVLPPGTTSLQCGDSNTAIRTGRGLPIAWRDTDCPDWDDSNCGLSATNAPNVLHGGMLDGTRRHFGADSAAALLVGELGEEHGVGDPP